MASFRLQYGIFFQLAACTDPFFYINGETGFCFGFLNLWTVLPKHFPKQVLQKTSWARLGSVGMANGMLAETCTDWSTELKVWPYILMWMFAQFQSVPRDQLLWRMFGGLYYEWIAGLNISSLNFPVWFWEGVLGMMRQPGEGCSQIFGYLPTGWWGSSNLSNRLRLKCMHTIYATWRWGKGTILCPLPCDLMATCDKFPWAHYLQWLFVPSLV